MKMFFLVFAVFAAPTWAFAGLKMIAKKDIAIPANKTTVPLISAYEVMALGAPSCLLKFEGQVFERTIPTGSTFEVLDQKISSLQKPTATQLKEQMSAHFNIDLKLELTTDEVVEFAKNKLGVVLDGEYYLTEIQIKSTASGTILAIECQSSDEKTAKSALAFLLKVGRLAPSTEL